MARPGEDRRGFLKQVAATSALLMSARGLSLAQVGEEDTPKGPPLGLAVVGCGSWGREILETLSRAPWAAAVGVCDTYAPYLRKAQQLAPAAKAVADYRPLLDSRHVEAVVVATPSHLHREVALAAISAGKHVYCEAPLASSADDARTIALAGQGAKTVFQCGLQGRSNPLYRHVSRFVKSGVLGSDAVVSGHWSRKDSWRRVAPSPGRERELNWRLDPSTSSGLPGEAGIHQIDLTSAFLDTLPDAVTGFGSIAQWKDGRQLPDTVQAVLEYPRGVRLVFSATLASSMGGVFTLFQGSNASLLLRETRGWLVKEADSALLGWEVYARKESVLDEVGIAMIADATKILAAGEEPGKAGGEPAKPPLLAAFEDFFRSIREGASVACGPLEGHRATLVAIQTDAASRSGRRLAITPESLELA
jgi:predicted dehydrogenase